MNPEPYQPLKDNSLDDILASLASQYKQQYSTTKKSNDSSTKMINPQSNHKNNSIDDFLNQLNQSKIAPQSHQSANNKSHTDSELDNLTQQFQQKHSKAEVNKKSDNLEESLNNLSQQFSQNKNQTKSTQQLSNLTKESLNNITQQFQQKKEEIKQEQKKDNLADIQQKELEKQRKIKQITNQAEIWLKNLDPYSDEGFWFEQFALSYPSKLEAAIEYLQAVQ